MSDKEKQGWMSRDCQWEPRGKEREQGGAMAARYLDLQQMDPQRHTVWQLIAQNRGAALLLFKLPKRTSPGPGSFNENISRSKDEFTAILHNVLQKIESEGILLNSFCEISVILAPKPKTAQKTTNIPHKQSYKSPCQLQQRAFSSIQK